MKRDVDVVQKDTFLDMRAACAESAMIRVGWMVADAAWCLPFTRSLLSFDPKPPNIKFSSSKVHLEQSLSRVWPKRIRAKFASGKILVFKK